MVPQPSEGSITSWEQLCRVFIANFKGTYERALTANEQRAVHQNPDESLRHYIECFSQVRKKIPNLKDSLVLGVSERAS